MVIKGIKSGENIEEWCYSLKHELTHIITSNKQRSLYYLYKVKGNKATKTDKKAKCPLDLDKWIWK